MNRHQTEAKEFYTNYYNQLVGATVTGFELVLDEFENETFRQVKGTAMGPKNACAYADTAINKIDVDVNEGLWEFKPVLWARFRDDIYIPWTHGLEKLNCFHQWLNTRIPGIKFTVSHSPHGIEFLDTFVYMKNNLLHTRPYSKPCDEHSFLVPSSCHPAHTLRNIPYGTALRLYRIASEHDEFTKAKIEYTEHLKARGYSIGIIGEAFNRVESKERHEYLGYPKMGPHTEIDSINAKVTQKVLPLVTDFNPGLPNIGQVLNKYKHILKLDPNLLKTINPDNIFTSFRGAKTLQDLLVHSRLPSLQAEPSSSSEEMEENPGGCGPCKKKCNLCKNFLKESDIAYSYHTNSIFKIKNSLDCDTENVIYIINDITCKISSIGCTADSMKVRFRNHKSHIKHARRTCEVSIHFSENQGVHVFDKSTPKLYDSTLKGQLEVIILEKVDVSKVGKDTQSRLKECKKREWYWQNQLKTLRQYGGMNVREERS